MAEPNYIQDFLRRARQIKQYAEIKMMKGHSEAQALKMAEEQLTTKEW